MRRKMVLWVLCMGITLCSAGKMFPVMTVQAAAMDEVQAEEITEASETVYATTSLNVRTGPGTEYDIVGVLTPGEGVEVTGICTNGWRRINYKEQICYVSGKYVAEQSEQTEQPEQAEQPGTEELQAAPEETAAVDVSGIAESKAGASQEWVDAVNQRLALVPENLKRSFVNNGWHIYATGENIAQTYFGGAYSSVRGVTSSGRHFIVVETRSEAVYTAPIHEFGHYLDCITGWPSTSAEFTEIYNEECQTFTSRIVNAGAVRDAREFFAETFYYVVTDPSKCTPRAEEFVRRYMGSV